MNVTVSAPGVGILSILSGHLTFKTCDAFNLFLGLPTFFVSSFFACGVVCCDLRFGSPFPFCCDLYGARMLKFIFSACSTDIGRSVHSKMKCARSVVASGVWFDFEL